MTKSGIGTQQLNTSGSNGLMSSNPSANVSNASSSGSSSTSSLIANAEIPIWVADKKKWVTGISKKTTINDLIYAILKQCQILPLQQNKQNDLINGTIITNQFEIIANQYVLIEYTIETNSTDSTTNLENVSAQRILNGDSKVYKYLNKWANSQLMSNQQQQQQQVQQTGQNLMLKILQRQSITNEQNSENISVDHNTNQQTTTSLATKLLKKFGVTNNSQPTNANNKTVSQNTISNNTTSNVSYRFTDVKLPTISSSQSQPNQLNKQPNTANTTPNQQRNFDPNTQKSFLYNAIMEKDNKLKQQVKRFQLIDELIKETEKSSKYPSSALLNQLNTDSVNNPTYTYSPSQSSSISTTSSSTSNNQINTNNQTVPIQPTNVDTTSKQFNTVDLNDIYCHFPEMCTHHLKEVEDFTLMCSQLFQLEEAIKSQKQVLSNLELDLQRELNQNQFNQQQVVSSQSVESVETTELRNEVNYSREQTRIQCKQLHDLDLRMRQNEQSLMVKEQQLQQLLEELYIQEIYADNALETAITNTQTATQNNSQLFLTSMINQSSSNNTPNSPKQNESNEDQIDTRHSELIINNEMLLNKDDKNKNYLTKRHVKMFGDSNDDMLINQALMQQQNSIKINNQAMMMPSATSQQQQANFYNTTNLQQKSQSIGNLTKCLPSPPPIPPTVLVSNNQLTTNQYKQINKVNHLTTTNTSNLNVNSDHSGDNDSGISSMSSETTTNQNCVLNTNTINQLTNPPSYIQQQQQRIIIQNNQYNQYLNNNTQQFQQVYRQQQTQQASPAGKSVLETLV